MTEVTYGRERPDSSTSHHKLTQPAHGSRRLILAKPSAFTWTFVTMCVVAGVVERFALLRSPALLTDSDEALAGLMARDLLHRGHMSTFLWGQPYGGAAEIVPVAASMAVFGQTLFAMRAFTVLLGFIAPVLLWRIATRMLTPVGALMAGVVLFTFPVAYVSYTIREYLYYTPLLVIGLGAILLSQRSIEEQGRWLAPLFLGVALGVGWWVSPFIAYFCIFIVATLSVFPRWFVRRGWLSVIGFAVGASPWIRSNLQTHFASLTTPTGFKLSSYSEHLGVFAHYGMPVLTGTRGWWTRAWLYDSKPLGMAIIIAVGVAAIVLGAVATVGSIKATAPIPADLLSLLAWPFIYAASPLSSAQTPYTPRYFILVWPFMALLIGRLLQNRRVVPIGIAALVAMAVPSFQDQQNKWIDWPDTSQLQTQLAAHNVHRLTGSYWLAYRINFETKGKVLATPAVNSAVRNPQLDRTVRESPSIAWAFRYGENKEDVFEKFLASRGDGAKPIPAGHYDLFIPATLVRPDDAPDAAKISVKEGN